MHWAGLEPGAARSVRQRFTHGATGSPMFNLKENSKTVFKIELQIVRSILFINFKT